MNRVLFCLVALLGMAQAQTTTNLHLNIPPTGTTSWGTLLNANFSALDAKLACFGTASVAGTVVYYNGSTWLCLPGNTSGTKVLQSTASGVLSWTTSNAGFDALASGTNNSAAMVLGSGSSLATSGTGSISATTQSAGDNTTKVATDAFVQTAQVGKVVNLLAAGAVCDGSTDDTAAIQAAYSSLTATYGGAIYWPPAGKTCVLSDTVTLANTQATHIIGGAVTWRGSPLNATASTAAQSGNVVTLTTTSGNWPAAFIVGGSIKVSSCSVAGYNGLSKIISGGTGGTTLTYIAAGATTGLGAATGCSAATLKPMFVYDEDISSTTESFRVTGGGTSQPLGVGFSIKQDSTYGVASQGNIFKGNIVEGQVSGGLNIGFEVTHGSASNPTNDEHKFFGNNIYNFSTAGFTIDFFQSVDIGFYSNTCYGINLVSLSCVIDTSGSGFNWTGGFTFGSMLADFYGYGQTAHPITIDSVGSEGSKRLAWISQSGQNPTGAPCPVNLMNDRFAGNSLAADGWAVVYECPGPLNVHGGSYGQFSSGFPTICWCSTYVSGENYAFGSIIGVDASANNSLAHPLLNIPFADASTIINIIQAGNIYTKSNQGGAPPTTPDLSYNAVTLLPGFGNTYDIGSSTFPWAHEYSNSKQLVGTSSGVISILPQAAAGTYNFNLPTTAGSSGQPLLSGGGGSTPMSFGPLALANLATQAADTIVGNATGSSAAPTAVAMPTGGTSGCAGASNALTYNTSTHAWGCNTISASAAWDAITAPASNLSLSMGSNISTFNTTTAVSNFFAWNNTTAATSSVAQSSPILSLGGHGWNGSDLAVNCTLQTVVTNGANQGLGLTVNCPTSEGATHLIVTAPLDVKGSTLTIGFNGNPPAIQNLLNGASLDFIGNMTSTANKNTFEFLNTGSAAITTTSGTSQYAWFPGNFGPTSGTSGFINLISNPTINQTGGANGTIRVLASYPVNTAVVGTEYLIAAGTSSASGPTGTLTDKFLVDSSGNMKLAGTAAIWTSGTGSPETAVTAPVGSVFTRTDGGANTTLYVKESGSGNTGWVAK